MKVGTEKRLRERIKVRVGSGLKEMVKNECGSDGEGVGREDGIGIRAAEGDLHR